MTLEKDIDMGHIKNLKLWNFDNSVIKNLLNKTLTKHYNRETFNTLIKNLLNRTVTKHYHRELLNFDKQMKKLLKVCTLAKIYAKEIHINHLKKRIASVDLLNTLYNSSTEGIELSPFLLFKSQTNSRWCFLKKMVIKYFQNSKCRFLFLISLK